MSKVILGIGVAGAGKTTVLEPLADKYNYVYLSPDKIREELTGAALDQTRNNEVWDIARERLVQYLNKGENVIFDATFTNGKERRAFIKFARDNGAEKVQGLFITTPPEIAKERNKKRERTIPEYAIDRMAEQLRRNPPATEDGFDSVFDIDEFGNLIRGELTDSQKIITKEFKIR